MKRGIINSLIFVFVFAMVIVVTAPRQQALSDKEKSHDIHTIRIDSEHQALDEMKRTEGLPAVDDNRVDAILHLAEVYWEDEKYSQAYDLLRQNWAALSHSNVYNNRLMDTMLAMAGMMRDQCAFASSEACYQKILDYDKKALPHGDLRVARDLQNMGVINYLYGLSTADKAKRVEMWMSASEYLNDARTMYNEKLGEGSPQEGNLLWTSYLVERDLGKQDLAMQLRDKALNIHNSLPHKAQVVY